MRRVLVIPLAVLVTGTSACTSSIAGSSEPGSRGASVLSTSIGPTHRPAPSSSSTPPQSSSSADPGSSSSVDPGSSSSVDPGSSSSTAAPSSITADSTTPAPGPTAAESPVEIFQHMTLRQRVGQLLMVDCPSSGANSATVTAIRRYDVGSIILDGTSYLGRRRTRQITDAVRADAPSSSGLLISTDQEGGEVQRLQGPGFDTIPSGVQQGTIAPTQLRADAQQWGTQLHRAGVNVNLAPVMDTVPPGDTDNPPIGDLDREFGHRPIRVSRHGVAVIQGLAAAHVAATAKHFPGLGRVTGNTDTTSGVTDSTTTAHDAYLRPFAAAVNAGIPLVMMSTAIYTRIDPHNPAAFSHRIVTGILRQSLGFNGVVISDDLGGAAQVSSYPVGDRAVRFIAAGGDMVLTVVSSQAGTMLRALIAKARSSARFRKLVNLACLRVLELKQQYGVLG